MEQFAGYLGYFGVSKDPEYNKKVEKANKLVDEYNHSINTIEGSANQMAYQLEMKNKMEQILGYAKKN